MSADKKDKVPEPFGGLGKTFGRRKGRPLRSHHATLMRDLLPQIEVHLPRIDGDGSDDKAGDLVPGGLDPQSLFTSGEEGGPALQTRDTTLQRREIWLEIGYGGGEHLAGQAVANRDIGMIGGEFFTQGVAKLLAKIEEGELTNVRLYAGDARELLTTLEDASLSRIFVLYPDPWPKKRHARRRFISPWSVAEFARLVKPGGEILVATDIPVYCRWTLMHFGADARFTWQAEGPEDWRTPPDGWIRTRYEAKALREGRTPAYLAFKRN